jgi:hypothetical protein
VVVEIGVCLGEGGGDGPKQRQNGQRHRNLTRCCWQWGEVSALMKLEVEEKRGGGNQV